MPFYIRKSVSAGPFRFNLSKSGIGVSAGVKGLRIGTGPRGHYIHAGRGGLYYRSTIPSSGKKNARTTTPTSPQTQNPSVTIISEPNVQMIRVSSADVLEMEDARFSDILSDLNEKQSSTSMRMLLGLASGLIGVFAALSGGVAGFIFGTVLFLTAMFVGGWLDGFRRTSVLMYDLSDEARSAYEEMTTAFDALLACRGKWHVDSGGAVRDIHTWKRNAGAGHLVDKRPTSFSYSLPRVVKSNITPPAIQSGKETLYFLPDFLLVVESKKIGAVAYDKLTIRSQESNFVEEGNVPADTEVLWHTWRYPNKNGGPDRRFKNNYQIPVCRYENIYLTSSNGLNELLQVSRAGVIAPFSASLSLLSKANGAAKQSPSLPQLT